MPSYEIEATVTISLTIEADDPRSACREFREQTGSPAEMILIQAEDEFGCPYQDDYHVMGHDEGTMEPIFFTDKYRTYSDGPLELLECDPDMGPTVEPIVLDAMQPEIAQESALEEEPAYGG